MSVYHGFIRNEKKDSLSHNMMYSYRHPSGFSLAVILKPGFNKRCAYLGVPYGAIDQAFYAAGPEPVYPASEHQTDLIRVPAGTAHFMEYNVFGRQPDSGWGLKQEMSALGVEANAYTDYAATVFYFSCVDNFLLSLRQYFQAICNPQISGAKTRAVRDIILSEIDMYADNPYNRLYKTAMSNAYHQHNMADLWGSPETVQAIKEADLQAVAASFYQPSAISLAIAGDFTEPEIRDILDMLAEQINQTVVTAGGRPVSQPEPDAVRVAEKTIYDEVENEGFAIALKNPRVNSQSPLDGAARSLHEMAGQVFFDSLLGEASPLYQTLYSEGLINESFFVEYNCDRTFACLMLGGETAAPERAAERVLQGLRTAVLQQQYDPLLFDSLTRALAGAFLRSLDRVDQCCDRALKARMRNIDLFDYASIFTRINLEDTIQAMSFVSSPDVAARVYLHKR
ncbi:insulinase family protein [Oscillospiraceae bacterium HV4-5-C5C]|nr:insulinase family protein [Oscillospiraceae bacterium HV4-5-C5C]